MLEPAAQLQCYTLTRLCGLCGSRGSGGAVAAFIVCLCAYGWLVDWSRSLLGDVCVCF